ncbi:MAG: hypothetical protein LBK23_06895 [Oscillospiraceae bacterium]|jgi:K+ transporter|nr:hypothetical protein [Oscillospiraceae bacterium]
MSKNKKITVKTERKGILKRLPKIVARNSIRSGFIFLFAVLVLVYIVYKYFPSSDFVQIIYAGDLIVFIGAIYIGTIEIWQNRKTYKKSKIKSKSSDDVGQTPMQSVGNSNANKIKARVAIVNSDIRVNLGDKLKEKEKKKAKIQKKAKGHDKEKEKENDL